MEGIETFGYSQLKNLFDLVNHTATMISTAPTTIDYPDTPLAFQSSTSTSTQAADATYWQRSTPAPLTSSFSAAAVHQDRRKLDAFHNRPSQRKVLASGPSNARPTPARPSSSLSSAGIHSNRLRNHTFDAKISQQKVTNPVSSNARQSISNPAPSLPNFEVDLNELIANEGREVPNSKNLKRNRESSPKGQGDDTNARPAQRRTLPWAVDRSWYMTRSWSWLVS